MIDKFNEYVKNLNANKPIQDLPDWTVRISSLDHGYNSRIELENDWVGTFFFIHYLDASNGILENVIAYDFCCEFTNSTHEEVEYRKALCEEMKKKFPED